MVDDKSKDKNLSHISEKSNENGLKTEKMLTKTTPKSSSEVQIGNNSSHLQPQLNENMIQKAVQFFQNPKVQNWPVNDQIHFLKSKGLTQTEIEEACQIAGVDTNKPSFQSPIPQPPRTTLQLITHYSTITLVVGSVFYALKWFYCKYIAPFIYRHFTKGHEQLNKIDTQIKKVKENLKKEQQKGDEKQKKLEEEILILREKISGLYK